MNWLHQTLVGFDLETTGTETAESRIVTAALVEAKGGEVVRQRDWLADPGVPIPAEAAAIHGISTERAVAEGRPVAEVADEVAAALCEYWRAGIQVVVFNASFDLSLLSAELRRHGLSSLEQRLGGAPVGPVLDPLTVYGVELADAHRAGSDALAALHVALALARKYPSEVGGLDPAELHRRQVGWHAAWAGSLQEWLRRGKEPQAVVDGAWPLRVTADATTG